MKVAALFASAVLSLALAAQAQERRVFPPDPQAGEAFAFVGAYNYGTGGYFTTSSIERDGPVITVGQPQVLGTTPLKWSRFGATMGGLPAGTYTIRAGPYSNQNSLFGYPVPAHELSVNVVAGTAAAPAHRELDGNWFDPAQPGWGVNLVQGDSGALFGVVLNYREFSFSEFANYPVIWHVVPDGRWITPTIFRGVLYESVGTRINEAATSSHTSPVGMATLEFLAPDRMKLRTVRATLIGVWLESEAILRRFEF
ncbi:MAG TPA: hypothetical protein VEC19_09415 [Usitatibacter sp.]|nr:hypothetical protein [Usitatibacter sp.]